MALTLSSRQLNFTKAILLSSAFMRISILSGLDVGSKKSVRERTLQTSRFRLETWITREGGLMAMDLLLLNLNYSGWVPVEGGVEGYALGVFIGAL